MYGRVIVKRCAEPFETIYTSNVLSKHRCLTGCKIDGQCVHALQFLITGMFAKKLLSAKLDISVSEGGEKIHNEILEGDGREILKEVKDGMRRFFLAFSGLDVSVTHHVLLV